MSNLFSNTKSKAKITNQTIPTDVSHLKKTIYLLSNICSGQSQTEFNDSVSECMSRLQTAQRGHRLSAPNSSFGAYISLGDAIMALKEVILGQEELHQAAPASKDTSGA